MLSRIGLPTPQRRDSDLREQGDPRVSEATLARGPQGQGHSPLALSPPPQDLRQLSTFTPVLTFALIPSLWAPLGFTCNRQRQVLFGSTGQCFPTWPIDSELFQSNPQQYYFVSADKFILKFMERQKTQNAWVYGEAKNPECNTKRGTNLEDWWYLTSRLTINLQSSR